MAPEQCYERIRICSRHFTDTSFTSSEKNHLNYNALPTLFVSEPTTSSNSEHTNLFKCSTEIQTDVCIKRDVSTQTDFIITTDFGCQTTQNLSARTPRKALLKEKISSLKQEVSQVKRKLETGITSADVENF